VERKLITEFSIDDEPFANFTSRNFIESVRVEVYTKEPDLKIQFLPIGTWEDFRIVGHNLPYKFTRQYNNLMFPNQGFILVFSKTS
jgi:hypothetical protein